jgi:microcystin-dependent protein
MFAGTYEPVDWAFCNGQVLRISDYNTLFSLIGVTYGGDGTTTFALPDLRGRIPVHAGQGTGLTPRTVSQKGGAEAVALAAANLPAHTHALQVSLNPASTPQPGGKVLAKAASLALYTTSSPATAMSANAISTTSGLAQAHNNMQPFLGINFIICLNGIFPPRN